MHTPPGISICIPAYKAPELTKQCLDSVLQQHFKDIEIIITDDSPGDEIYELVKSYLVDFPLVYIHNDKPLGPPANWNAAIALAKGKYVYLLHRDDRIADPDLLSKFYRLMEANPDAEMGFTRCINVFPDGKEEKRVLKPEQIQFLRHHQPERLILGNFIGVPSATIFKNHMGYFYDAKFKWLVDVEFYMRILANSTNFVFVDGYGVKVGLHEGQVTHMVEGDASVVIKEYILLLNKFDDAVLKQLPFYSYYWRMLRNYKVRGKADLHKIAPGESIDKRLVQMAQFQYKLPLKLLKIGWFSRPLMFLGYLFSK